MDQTLLISVLSSTVIAGLISAGAALYSGHKKNLIDHITSDRKAWRSEIREIAVKIEAADTREQLRKPLAELKVRINAFGIQDGDVLHDSAIWLTLEQIRNANSSKIPDLKEKLLRLLSCLLKYDWDRSKAEIRGNVLIAASIVMQMIAVSIAVTVYLLNPENLKLELLAKMRGIELFAMPAFMIVLAYFCLYGLLYGKKSPPNRKLKSKGSIVIQSSITLSGFIVVFICSFAVFFISRIYLPSILAIISIILILIHLGNDLDARNQYKQTVEAIMK